MTTSADGSGPGVNVVGRAAAVLRAVAAAEPTGISTTDLARSAGLARPTAHRLLTALAAEGKSVIQNILQVDRGYENIDARLRTLGAKIARVG